MGNKRSLEVCPAGSKDPIWFSKSDRNRGFGPCQLYPAMVKSNLIQGLTALYRPNDVMHTWALPYPYVRLRTGSREVGS